MTKLFAFFALAASLVTTSVADFTAVHASLTWTPGLSITNQTGTVRQDQPELDELMVAMPGFTGRTASRAASCSTTTTTKTPNPKSAPGANRSTRKKIRRTAHARQANSLFRLGLAPAQTRTKGQRPLDSTRSSDNL